MPHKIKKAVKERAADKHRKQLSTNKGRVQARRKAEKLISSRNLRSSTVEKIRKLNPIGPVTSPVPKKRNRR